MVMLAGMRKALEPCQPVLSITTNDAPAVDSSPQLLLTLRVVRSLAVDRRQSSGNRDNDAFYDVH